MARQPLPPRLAPRLASLALGWRNDLFMPALSHTRKAFVCHIGTGIILSNLLCLSGLCLTGLSIGQGLILGITRCQGKARNHPVRTHRQQQLKAEKPVQARTMSKRRRAIDPATAPSLGITHG